MHRVHKTKAYVQVDTSRCSLICCGLRGYYEYSVLSVDVDQTGGTRTLSVVQWFHPKASLSRTAPLCSLSAASEQELGTMVSLPEHPNVLRLLGACTVPPQLCLITEYCARGSLYGE